ncbi:MAG: YebC/PmpR family DNA-binding transcriptional regulator [Planctomycetota bacterium]|nr:YebC/PmpR family DNA-binding transcriptional regulator [Planctomycetota bacterium]
MALRSGRYHNVRHQKDAADRKRAAVWAKLAVQIASAVQLGGSGRPEDNPRLRLAIARARAAEMSSEAIERAIRKGLGQGGEGARALCELTYEGYAAGGVAVVVDAVTDNRNRTAPEIKKLFEVHGGALGTPGCVAWQFRTRACCLVAEASEERVLEALLAARAEVEDLLCHAGGVEVIAEPQHYDALVRALTAADLQVREADIVRMPECTVPLADQATAHSVQALLVALDEHPDVQAVYHNAELPV